MFALSEKKTFNMAHLVEAGGAAASSAGPADPATVPMTESELEDLGSISSALSLVSPNEKQFDLIGNRLKKLLDEGKQSFSAKIVMRF